MREEDSIWVECFLSFALMLPSSGSDEQPQWLINFCQTAAFEGQRAYEPNASERLLSPRLVILNLVLSMLR